jgi:nucleoside-triphosphatase THEP1
MKFEEISYENLFDLFDYIIINLGNTEFDRKVLEVLRQPIEAKEIVIFVLHGRSPFQPHFQLIAAMNRVPWLCF